MKNFVSLFALATVPFLAPRAFATTVTYTNQATFFTAAGPVVTQNFDNFAAGTIITNQLTGISSVTTDGNNGSTHAQVGSIAALPFPLTAGLPTSSGDHFLSSELAAPTYASAHLIFNFSANENAVGLYLVDGAPLADTILNLYENSVLVASLDFGEETLPNSYLGVVSTVAFNSINVGSASPYDSFGIDDLSYSPAATPPPPTPGPVPEPASLVLTGIGSALAGVNRWRNRRKV